MYKVLKSLIEALSGSQTVISDTETREKLPLCRYTFVNCQCGLLLLVTILALSLYFATFRVCFSAANQPQLTPTANNRFGYSAVFAVQGNVYPLGYGFFYNFIGFNWFLMMVMLLV